MNHYLLKPLLLLTLATLLSVAAGCAPPAERPPTADSRPPSPSAVGGLPAPPPSAVASPPLSPPPPAKPLGTRQELSLDGKWEYLKVKSLDDAPPTTGWQAFNMPGLINGYDYERAWFRRKFNVAEQWWGQRVLLQFGGVKYNSRVLVNGKNVGGALNGYDAFELDITDAVKLGAENELRVGAYDWTGIFTGAPVTFPAGLGWDELRAVPRDRILAPIGGLFTLYGIWDSVTLRVVPAARVQSIFVRPLVQQNRLEVDVTIANTGAQAFAGSLQARVFDWFGTGRNAGEQWELRGTSVATFAPIPVSVAAGKSFTTTLRLDKPPLELWSPYSPRLYILEVGFEGGDAVRERIGWREFETRGGDFYLNGKKVHLLATSWWPPQQPVTREYIASELKAIRAMNAVAFRTHTQPWPEMWYEVADEIGVMMIPEGAVWNDDNVYRVDDSRFWENYAAHLRGMVTRLRNHPSIVMWSLENEFYGSRAKDDTPAEARLAQLGQLVKRDDPTRPITYESDGDPGGATDVIGIHYPNEFPERRLWPQDAYWLDAPRLVHGGGGMFWDNQPFLWERKKPLYIGEYLWIPSPDPSTQTLFFGDEAYRNHELYRTRAKALAWRMQMLAYRHYGVSGQSPWTVREEGPMDERNPTWVAHRDLYRPLAAFVRDADARFFAGETVRRTIELFNDAMSDLAQTEFRWTLLDATTTVASGSENLTMPSGDHQTREIKIVIPTVIASGAKQSPSNSEIASSQSPLLAMTPTPLTLRLTMRVANEERFREDYAIEVFPRAEKWSLPATPIVVYDPKGTLANWGKQVSFRSLKQLADWDGQGILVVAPDALTKIAASDIPIIGDTTTPAPMLAQKVQQGGRVLVLEQTDAASDWLPVQLGTQSSTIAFPQIASHPILRGITADDLRWWRGDNVVSRYEPLRPALAGVRPLVVTGSARGVANAPLVEVQQGNGVWLISQLQVVTKLDTEPMARILFERMLQYLAALPPVIATLNEEKGKQSPNPTTEIASSQPFDSASLRSGSLLAMTPTTVVIASPEGAKQSPTSTTEIASSPSALLAMTGSTVYFGAPSLHDHLARIGADAQPLSDWNALQFPRVQLLVLQSDAATISRNADKLREFMNAGGQVLWHRPDPKDFASARDVLKLPVTMQAYRGFALRAEGAGDFFEMLLREDLYWLGKHEGSSQRETPLATDVTDYVFVQDEKTPQGETFEAERNVELAGTSVRAQGNEIVFATNGSARWTVQLSKSGLYQFGLLARGTPVKDVYPIVQVSLDDEPMGMLYIAKREAAYFAVQFRADAGSHQITIAFTNDLWAPPEDRNLYVDRYVIALAPDAATTQALTTPAALVSVPMGKGRLVLNAIRWDDAGRNQQRAQRFIASLLTTLGARLQSRGQIAVIEAETMTPQANQRLFRREGDYVVMPASGYFETRARVATAGRYRVGIMTKGTPADGVYPIIALELDGKEIGKVECKSDDWTMHYFAADLPAGTFNLRLRFTNDLYLPDKGEDRNVWVDRIEFELVG